MAVSCGTLLAIGSAMVLAGEGCADTQAVKDGYIPSLDGLRAFSILIVFFSHAGLGTCIPGVFGVTVFFFLSGYLITTLMRQEWASTGTLGFRRFYLRRVLRIFPALYVSLVFASLICVVGILSAALTWKAFFAQALFLANYYEIRTGGFGMPSGMEVLWSLAVEEHFYLLFPLIYFVLRRAKASSGTQAAVLASICFLTLAWRLALVHALGVHPTDGSQGWARMAHATDTRLDGILWGCVLAVYGNPFLDRTRIPAAIWRWLLLPLGLGVLLFTFIHRDEAFRSTYRYSLQAIALVPVFVTGVRYPSWGPLRVLNWSGTRRFGVLSYSFYLLHSTVIAVVARYVRAPMSVRVLLSFGLSLLASDLVWRIVERPLASLRKRLDARDAKAAGDDLSKAGAPPALVNVDEVVAV